MILGRDASYSRGIGTRRCLLPLASVGVFDDELSFSLAINGLAIPVRRQESTYPRSFMPTKSLLLPDWKSTSCP